MIILEDIRLAQRRMRGVALPTPLVPCPHGDEDRTLYFKAENVQPTGAFKLRGAYNKISSLPPEERRRGVGAHPRGNHSQALASPAPLLRVRPAMRFLAGPPRAQVAPSEEPQ